MKINKTIFWIIGILLLSSFVFADGLNKDMSGLFAWYQMDNETEMLIDDSSNSHTLTEVSDVVASVDAIYGQSGYFTINDYLLDDTGFNLNNASGFSFGAWVKFTNWENTNIILGTSNEAESRYNNWQVTAANNLKYYGNCNGNAYAVAINGIPSNTWVHLTSVYDGTTHRFYYNGIENGTQVKACDISADIINQMTLGTTSTADRGNGAFIWDSGYMDEAFFFNRALTASQVYDIYSGETEDINLTI